MHRLAKSATLVAFAALVLTACDGPAGTSTPTVAASPVLSVPLECPPGKLRGEGSSAQRNAMQEVVAAYGVQCKNKATIEYNASGSGSGIKSFYNGLVDWAGSDSALQDKQIEGISEIDRAKVRCQGNEAWNLPMVVGPVAIAYHIDGVSKLVLSPEALAKIFNGTIVSWNDPLIAKLNPGVQLPKERISVFFRSDESGTTENLTGYLNEASETNWPAENISKFWRGKGEGKAKSDGVAQAVAQTNYSISYVEWSYAKDAKLSVAQIDNGAGAVELTGTNVSKNIGEATIKSTGNNLELELKRAHTSAGSYPINLVTYEVVCSKGVDPERTRLLKDYMTFYASSEQQKALEQIGYAPLPDNLRTRVLEAIKAIQ